MQFGSTELKAIAPCNNPALMTLLFNKVTAGQRCQPSGLRSAEHLPLRRRLALPANVALAGSEIGVDQRLMP